MGSTGNVKENSYTGPILSTGISTVDEQKRLLEIKNNLEIGASIVGTSADTQKQLAEIDRKLKQISTNILASDISNMSSSEISEYLENAPVGTQIKGVLSARTGNEVVVEKISAQRPIYGGVGAGSRIAEEYWTVSGEKNPYIKRIFTGKSPYYTISTEESKKRKKK